MTDWAQRLDAASHAAWVEEMIGLIRHDIGNKLGSIRNASFYLQRTMSGSDAWKNNPRVPKFFTLIEKQLDATHEIVREGNATERLFERRSEDLPLAPVLERIQERHPALRTDVGDQSIHCDPSELELMLECLVLNGIEAGGTPTVVAEAQGARLLVRVEDDGHGIQLEPPERALEAFTTTHTGRPGLGLPIVRRIARRYSGTVKIASTGATGTTVEVSFSTREDP